MSPLYDKARKPLRDYVSSDYIEFVLGILFLFLGALAPTMIALVTDQFLPPLIPLVGFALLALVIELYPNQLCQALCWWDSLIGVKSGDKTGLLLGSGIFFGGLLCLSSIFLAEFYLVIRWAFFT